MTRIKFIAFLLFTALISSCSSDENTDDNTNGNGNENPSVETSFNLTYDNQVKKVKSWEANKQGDFIEVLGTTEDGVAIDFKFNVYGNLYEASTVPTKAGSNVPALQASENFTANTFTFTLENINTTNKTVQVKFSGKVYEDAYDSESDFVVVSGSFKVQYKDITPEIEGQGTFAKLDGKDWHGIVMSGSIENLESKILYAENDGEYTFEIVYPNSGAKTGTFTFTTTSANRISFQKYDVATHDYIDYEVSGTVTYTTLTSSVVAGTFSLTATHPETKAKIVITAGTFKEKAPLF
ncbi:hypothetical protein EV143_103490 [Flavobacterium chryseum]|uniref:DUF6252 family protein n=1 Tax=Flavobacterium sp. P3160 TaxID=2512113 RepID=UPI00106097BC|nr:DUF6252 family protein [Flavobacterium sp. P3160]TDO78237.1 hypothetical protein EV143_103490 [Flavobacterium sp. P3160]